MGHCVKGIGPVSRVAWAKIGVGDMRIGYRYMGAAFRLLRRGDPGYHGIVLPANALVADAGAKPSDGARILEAA